MSVRYSFGEFVLSPSRRLLIQAGTEISLVPRYFDLLVLLIRRRDEAVTRNEILDEVWEDVVVSDGALSQAVRTLRRALGDDPRNARFIRTVSRHGYQFVFHVDENNDSAPLPSARQMRETKTSAELVSDAPDDARRIAAENLHGLDTGKAVARLRDISDKGTQFVDLTTWVKKCVRRSGVSRGLVQIQAMHTTAAIVVNEKEPLLLEDFRALLEQVAPAVGVYAHDDLERRSVNLVPEDRPNGHAHARALLMGSSKSLNIRKGSLALGRWQSIFFVELDGPRRRTVSLTIMGSG